MACSGLSRSYRLLFQWAVNCHTRTKSSELTHLSNIMRIETHFEPLAKGRKTFEKFIILVQRAGRIKYDVWRGWFWLRVCALKFLWTFDSIVLFEAIEMRAQRGDESYHFF